MSVGSAITNPLFKSFVACDMALESEVVVMIVRALFIASFPYNNLLKVDRNFFI